MNTSDKNWESPSELSGLVFEDQIACLKHIQTKQDSDHGEHGEIPFLPVETDKKVNTTTPKDAVEEHLRKIFGNDDLLATIQEAHNADLPPVLTEDDIEKLKIIDISNEMVSDLEKIEKDVRYYDMVMSEAIQTISSLKNRVEEFESGGTQQSTQSQEVEEVNTGGAYTTSDLLEAEQEEVMNLLNRIGYFDDMGDVAYEIFEYVYECRTENEDVRAMDVSSEKGMPEDRALEILTELANKGAIEHNKSDDTFFYIY